MKSDRNEDILWSDFGTYDTNSFISASGDIIQSLSEESNPRPLNMYKYPRVVSYNGIIRGKLIEDCLLSNDFLPSYQKLIDTKLEDDLLEWIQQHRDYCRRYFHELWEILDHIRNARPITGIPKTDYFPVAIRTTINPFQPCQYRIPFIRQMKSTGRREFLLILITKEGIIGKKASLLLGRYVSYSVKDTSETRLKRKR